MIRSQKIELNPNNKQSTLMAQHCGYKRVAFNFALSSFKAGLDTDEWRTHVDITLDRIGKSKKLDIFKRKYYNKIKVAGFFLV